jgi:hypothetical protein
LFGFHEGSTGFTQIGTTGEFSNENWSIFNRAPDSGANTSPSVSMSCESRCTEHWNAAVNASNGRVWFRTWYLATTWTESGIVYASHSSPSMSNFWLAVNRSNGDLYVWNVDNGEGPGDTGLGMAAETSPALFSPESGGYTVAFHAASSNDLWIDQNGTSWNTGIALAAGTSPAITPSGDVAVHTSSSDHLWIYNIGTKTATETSLPITGGSSPSITNWGGYLVAFEHAGTNHLGLYQKGFGAWETAVSMQAGSSPSIARRCFATECHWDAIVQGSNHHLVSLSETAGAREFSFVLGAHSSPSISGGL